MPCVVSVLSRATWQQAADFQQTPVFRRSAFFRIQSAHAIGCVEPSSEKTHMLTLNSIIQRDPNVIAAEADQDLIMVSIATGYYYGLSDVAREIWDAIERPTKVSDLVDHLTSSHDVNSSLCEEQTVSFLEALLAEDLLQVTNESAG